MDTPRCHDDLVERIATLATRAPRYTSYPPATVFGALPEGAVAAELAALARHRQPASLYLHIPFCRSLCAYCGCNVIPTRDANRGVAYVGTLSTELTLLARQLGEGFPLAEVCLGGGSPNFLSPPALRHLMASVRRYFAVEKNARLSIELDPRDTTSSQIEMLAATGFRAVSVGVQDFSTRVQDAIRRHQTEVQTKWLIDRARAAGFTDVNLDIVYGLPHQSEHSFGATLDTVIALAPDRVALFGYAHLPSKLPHQWLVERDGARLPDAYERAQLLLLGIDKLTAAGYLHLGLDHFAKPGSPLARAAAAGTMTRSFQGYVERRAAATIGAGCSAISTTPNAIWQNHVEHDEWAAAIQRGELPIARGRMLDRDDCIRRDLITHLMCEGRAELDSIGNAYAIDPIDYFAPELRELGTNDELAYFDAGAHTIHVTDTGRLLVRNVCALFDRYLPNGGAGRFSPTI